MHWCWDPRSQADLHANIDYLAPNGAPDNDRKAKESSWLVSQAFIEGLRYYPNGQTSLDSNDSEATYSGNTLSKKVYTVEHMETDLRSRCAMHACTPDAHRQLPPAPCLPPSSHTLPATSRCPRSLSIAPADSEWREDQCPREWVPEKRKSMVKHMAKVRERLKK